jgi:MFS superfamily sulfate permease-like transporter
MDLIADEREPLLSVRSGGGGAGTASEAEEDYASSSASSIRYSRQQRGYPERPQALQRTESTQQPYWRICIPQVHLPIPDIFICVVVFTVATVIFDLDTEYGIAVIGMIPTGLPTMAWPGSYIDAWSTQDWMPMLWPGILMAMIVYVMSLSVAKHFGREYGYEIDADQEMLALGVSSLVGSCFGGYACTGNLTRTAILAQLGAKTPLASLVGAFMVLMSLLWFTVLFERIPNTVLAAIVLVALTSLFAHAVEVKRLWRVGRRKEALTWWTTFISVIVFSIEIGLAVGISLVVILKLYKHGMKWKRVACRYIKHSATYQRTMLMLGLHSPLFTTAGRGLYTNDDEDDY